MRNDSDRALAELIAHHRYQQRRREEDAEWLARQPVNRLRRTRVRGDGADTARQVVSTVSDTGGPLVRKTGSTGSKIADVFSGVKNALWPEKKPPTPSRGSAREWFIEHRTVLLAGGGALVGVGVVVALLSGGKRR